MLSSATEIILLFVFLPELHFTFLFSLSILVVHSPQLPGKHNIYNLQNHLISSYLYSIYILHSFYNYVVLSIYIVLSFYKQLSDLTILTEETNQPIVGEWSL